MYSALIFAPDSHQESNLQADGLIALGNSGYWASSELLCAEARLYKAYEFFHDRKSPLKLDADKLAAEKTNFISCSKSRVDKAELDEQLCAVFRTFDKSASLSIFTGPPGAAKSTTAGLWMQFVRMQYPAMPVILIAQEKTALDRLYDKINFPGACAWTVETSLQRDWPREAAIIIDEAGILGTETMADLLQKAAKSDAAKLILIGDDKQLVPHAPGQPFRWLYNLDSTDKITMTQSFRQKTTGLRQAVKALYNEEVSDALKHISFAILPPEEIAQQARELAITTAPDKTLIVIHGPDLLIENIKAVCPEYRVLSLAASQGLAIDRVVFILGQEINRAELLVGCSRQRHALEMLIDAGVYAGEKEFAEGVMPFPANVMALDIIGADELLALLGT